MCSNYSCIQGQLGHLSTISMLSLNSRRGHLSTRTNQLFFLRRTVFSLCRDLANITNLFPMGNSLFLCRTGLHTSKGHRTRNSTLLNRHWASQPAAATPHSSTTPPWLPSHNSDFHTHATLLFKLLQLTIVLCCTLPQASAIFEWSTSSHSRPLASICLISTPLWLPIWAVSPDWSKHTHDVQMYIQHVVYAVIVVLLSACMLMLSYVIIVSCIDAHTCMDKEWVFLHPMKWLWLRAISAYIAA